MFITDGLCRKEVGEEMEEEMLCRHITKDFFLTLPPDIDRDLKIRAGFAL